MAENVSVYRKAFRMLVGQATSQRGNQKRVLMGQTAAVRGDIVILARPPDASDYFPLQELNPASSNFAKFAFAADLDTPDQTTYFYR